MKVLVADDDLTSRSILTANLEKWGYEVKAVSDGISAVEELSRPDAPQLAILDRLMPGMDGTDVCRKIREVERERYIYIILLTACSKSADIVEGMNAGADDYLVKPYNMAELKVRLNAGRRIIELQNELMEARNRLEVISMTDPLTGIFNRRAVLDRLSREMARAKREDAGLFIAIMDLDFFKRINDRYGHLVGDEVLKGFAKRLTTSIRPYDTAGRIGGEEFLLIMTGTDTKTAVGICERIREATASKPIETKSVSVRITVSIGVALWDGSSTIDALIAAADAALYRSKKEGRNRVTVAERVLSG